MSETYQENSENSHSQNDVKQVFGLTERELDELRERAKEKQNGGTWKQKGAYLIKEDVDYPFGIHIGTKKQLVGVDEKGNPILKDLK